MKLHEAAKGSKGLLLLHRYQLLSLHALIALIPVRHM